MLNETTLGIFFWGAYGWLCIGFLVIGIPAIIELGRIFSGTKK